MPTRVVFDTNILISAIVYGGNPLACFEMARTGEIELYTSRALLLELAVKLKEKFKWSDEEVKDVLIGISKFAQIIRPKKRVAVIKSDPTDNKVLEVAREIVADFIISGDKKHILPLRKFEKTIIINAAEFLKQTL